MAHIDLTEEVEEVVFSARHKAATLVGLMESPKGRQKTEVIEGIIRSLEEDTEALACELFEAHYQERHA